MRDIKDQYNYKPHDMAKAQLEYFLNRGMSFHAIVNTALDRMYREEKREMDKELMESVYSLQRYRVTVKQRESESEPPAFTPAMMRMVTDWNEDGDVIEIDAYDCIETYLDRSEGVAEWTNITETEEL
jgi:hypothetical protein